MQKNVASQKLIVFAFDATTNLPKTGDAANLTAYVSKDYGAVTVLGDTSATEMDSTNAKGYYLFDLTQAETNADTLLFSAKSSTANIVVVGAPATVFTTPANFAAQSIDSNGRVDVIKLAGTTQTARDIGASVLLSNGTGTGQVKLASGYVAMTWADIAAPTTAVNLSGTTISTSQAVASVSGAVGSVTGNVGGNVTGSVGSVLGNVGGSIAGSVDTVVGDIGGSVLGTIGGLTAAALADFFDTDSGTTYGAAVAGSVVAEIANNAGGSSLTEAGIAETVCEYMHTFDTTYGTADIAAGSVLRNTFRGMIAYNTGLTSGSIASNSVAEVLLYGMFDYDTGYDAAGAIAGSVVGETVSGTAAGVATSFFTVDNGLDYSSIGVGSAAYALMRAFVAWDTSLTTNDVTANGAAGIMAAYNVVGGMGLSPGDINSDSTVGIMLRGLFLYDTTATFSTAVPGSSVYETATNATVAGLTFTVAGQVDANIRYVNNIAIDGVGTSGNPWGPA